MCTTPSSRAEQPPDAQKEPRILLRREQLDDVVGLAIDRGPGPRGEAGGGRGSSRKAAAAGGGLAIVRA